jgi:hypothetical protein
MTFGNAPPAMMTSHQSLGVADADDAADGGYLYTVPPMLL